MFAVIFYYGRRKGRRCYDKFCNIITFSTTVLFCRGDRNSMGLTKEKFSKFSTYKNIMLRHQIQNDYI